MRRKNKIGYKNRFGGALKFCRKPGHVIRQNYAEYCIYEIFIHISDNSIVVSDIIKVDGKRDKTATNLGPFEYSELEQQYLEDGGELFPHIMGTDSLGRDYFVRVV